VVKHYNKIKKQNVSSSVTARKGVKTNILPFYFVIEIVKIVDSLRKVLQIKQLTDSIYISTDHAIIRIYN
jgi:hypothetical protein